MPKAYVWKNDDQSGSKPAATGCCTAETLEFRCLGTHPGTVWFAAIDVEFADIDPTANTTLSKSSIPMSQGNKVAGTRINIRLYGELALSLRHVWSCFLPSAMIA